jgi:hypothetical protein
VRPEWKRISCRFQELICYYTGSIFQVVPGVLPIQISISLFVDETLRLDMYFTIGVMYEIAKSYFLNVT